MLNIELMRQEQIAPWKYNRLRRAPYSNDWTDSIEVESRMHRIHSYPARFPAFIVHRALEHARRQGVEVNRIADIFCGSGTVLFEASRRNIGFWGCDFNPVATLIAKVKSYRLDADTFGVTTARIVDRFASASRVPHISGKASDRLRPWFEDVQFDDLVRLRNAVLDEVGDHGEFAAAFDCAFSAILKPVSRWRSRSRKPSLDPLRSAPPVIGTFVRQCRMMQEAWAEVGSSPAAPAEIVRGSVIDVPRPAEPIDLIVTSPPYATSYEYADLHQLSALWLGFADDHRDLRPGFIGTSSRRSSIGTALRNLNSVGEQVVFSLFDRDRPAAEATATYFLDMQKVAQRCHEFLRPGGISVFVVGNTQLSGVRIDNANHLVESLIDSGFVDVSVVKRQMSNKPNTPYRLPNGRLSSNRTEMQIYAEEYIIMAQRG